MPYIGAFRILRYFFHTFKLLILILTFVLFVLCFLNLESGVE